MSSSTNSQFYRLIVVLIIAFLLRWTYFVLFNADAHLHEVDPRGYQQLAVNLVTGHGFSIDANAPYLSNLLRTPLYPSFVAVVYFLLGINPIYVVAAQIFIDVGICLLLWMLALELMREPGIALAAALLYALTPSAWLFATSLLTETILAFVLLLTTLAVVRFQQTRQRRQAMWIGLLCGAMILIKPNVLLLPLVVVITLVFGSSQWGYKKITEMAFIILMSCGMVLLPWVLRNYRIVQRPILSTAFLDNTNTISAVSTLLHARGEREPPFSERWTEVYGEIITETAVRYHWSPNSPITAPDALQRLFEVNEVSREIIRENPVHFFMAHVEGFLRSWFPHQHRVWYEHLTGQEWALGQENGERTLPLTLLAVFLALLWHISFVLLAVLCVIGIHNLKNNIPFLLFFGSCLFYLTFLPGPMSGDRFRFPAVPLITVVVAIGLTRWLKRGRLLV